MPAIIHHYLPNQLAGDLVAFEAFYTREKNMIGNISTDFFTLEPVSL